ncbi:hypothetical protein EPI10_023723 [Gossypium australe]|uniref:Uncharacterized protein n=1 Tax=Gossypium australe TaxID=47621 RepID=A0A5B6VWX5_9ROSI|nr:hypothetical protein EPI10_023723 [Gossypium australe]
MVIGPSNFCSYARHVPSSAHHNTAIRVLKTQFSEADQKATRTRQWQGCDGGAIFGLTKARDVIDGRTRIAAQ